MLSERTHCLICRFRCSSRERNVQSRSVSQSRLAAIWLPGRINLASRGDAFANLTRSDNGDASRCRSFRFARSADSTSISGGPVDLDSNFKINFYLFCCESLVLAGSFVRSWRMARREEPFSPRTNLLRFSAPVTMYLLAWDSNGYDIF